MQKLQLGCGRSFFEGWINTNHTTKPFNLKLYEEKRSEGYDIRDLDITKEFPFEDNSIDFIFSEHVIEHVKEKDGINCLSECLRVLKPGGVIRTIAPSREFYESIRYDDQHPFVKEYAKQIYKREPSIGMANKIYERTMYDQGHHWVPTLEMLKAQHEKVGFKNVISCDYGQSEHDELAMDMRDGLREYESIVVEGIK